MVGVGCFYDGAVIKKNTTSLGLTGVGVGKWGGGGHSLQRVYSVGHSTRNSTLEKIKISFIIFIVPY
jgi:hypothetical protein